MTLMRILLAAFVGMGIGAAQTPTETADTTTEGVVAAQKSTYEETHIMVVPNYATVNDPSKTYKPLTTGEKFKIAAHDSFDPFNWVLTGVYAAVYQKENNYAFGQGGAAYAKRYGAVFADGAISTFFSEAIMPTLLHEDPRYFRLGEGNKWKRTGYALTRVLVTRTDAGNWRFNNSEIFGNMMAAGISHRAYYPAANRSVGETFERFSIGVVSDAGFNVLKEFWPDMRHKVLHR